ncbi:MAG: PAS domain-containing protein, partial [Deltaproteobacteria bacterium]|nr:PAS domain-containing protein [Deltaproteobacteria bacterium]
MGISTGLSARASFLEELSNPAFIVNDTKIVELGNSSFYNKFDLRKKDVERKMSCEEVCNTDNCGTKNCPIDKCSRMKKVVTTNAAVKSNGDKAIHYNFSATPLFEEKKQVGTMLNLVDITDQQSVNTRLTQLENNLNAIPTPILEIDRLFNITYMNPAGASVAGLMPEEVVGKKCYDLFKTPHCKTEKCACAQAMKTDSTVTEQTISRPRDGVIIPIKYTGSPLKDAAGNITGAVEYVVDITEEASQKQDADEKINNLNSIPTPILAMDTDFTITYMNPTGAAALGMTPDEATGKKCYDLFKTPHCRTEKCACAQAMKTDSIVTEQTIARPKEGVIIPIKYTGAPIKDAKGNIKGVLEYVTDITEEAKQKQDADEKINNLNSIPTPILAMDTEYNVTYINPTGAAALGMTP